METKDVYNNVSIRKIFAVQYKLTLKRLLENLTIRKKIGVDRQALELFSRMTSLSLKAYGCQMTFSSNK